MTPQSAVTYALDNGYTLIDTANVYVNERAVGRGMRASSKARERCPRDEALAVVL